MNPSTPQRQRDADRSREAILDAAEQLFAEHGLEGVSLQAIGERAGVSRGLPNYLFGAKEQLYQATIERLLQAEHDAVVAQSLVFAEDASSEEVLTAAIRSHLEFLSTRPAFLKLIVRESLRSATVLRDANNYLAVLEAGRAIIAREQARGGISASDPNHVLMQLLALCWFPFSHADTIAQPLGVDWREPNFVETHTAAVVRLLFDGIRPR